MYAKRIRGQMSESMLTAVFIILSGGLQDSYTYLCRGKVFANAQTGNIVLLSAYLFDGEWSHCTRYLVPVLAFMLGIFVAECVHRHYKYMERVHWRQLIILSEIVLLFAVGFLPQTINTFANAVVSFVCAMQVESFRKIEGNAYATTMCIGNLRSGMEYLYRWHVTRDRAHLHRAKVYYLVILVFVLGAALGGVTCRSLGRLSILICCPLLLSAVAVMAWTKRSAEHGKKK